MAQNQEVKDEDFSQDVQENQHLNGDELSAGENGTDNGNSNGNDNGDKADDSENGAQSNEQSSGRDDDRYVKFFHYNFFRE